MSGLLNGILMKISHYQLMEENARLQTALAIAERALEEVAHLFQVHTYNIATRALDEIRKEKG
jgi:hypothetical protein